MELTIYDVIKRPRISDKAHRLNKKFNQLVIEVHPEATKPLIRTALERLFNVKVEDVRTSIRKYRRGRGVSKRRNFSMSPLKHMKIAYISLAEGYSLNLLEQVDVTNLPSNATE